MKKTNLLLIFSLFLFSFIFSSCTGDVRAAESEGPIGQSTENIRITSPKNGDVVEGLIDLVAEGRPSDQYSYVEFFLNEVLWGTASARPYSIPLDTTLLEDGPQEITVRAYDSNKKVMAPVRVSISSKNALNAPSSLLAVANGSSQMALTWRDNSDNEDGFRVERATSTQGVFTEVGAGVGANTTSFLNTGLASNTTYLYRVRAIRGTKVSSYSNTASATTAMAADLVAPTVTINYPFNGLTLKNVFEMAATATDNIGVVRVDFLVDGVVKGSSSTAPYRLSVDSRLLTQGSHTFGARAMDAAGNVSVLSTTVATVDNAPSAPTNLVAQSLSTSSIRLTWADTSDNELGFKVERSTSLTGGYLQIATTGGDAVSLTDSGLTAATTYFYRVRSYNASAHSLYTSPSSAMTGAAPDTTLPTITLTAPTNLTVVKGSSVLIAATASDDRGVARVDFYAGSAVATPLIGSDAVAPYSFVLNSTTLPDAEQTITVKAVDAAGNVSLPATITVTVQNKPTAPTALVATAASSSQINLSWTDNSDNETKFEVERATVAGGLFTLLASPTANVVTQSDFSLSPSTTYYYRVRAVNTAGPSSYTPVVTGVTNAAVDTQVPVVSITSPLNTAILRGTIDFNATASDNMGVKQVDFFIDSVLKSTATVLPYTTRVDTVLLAEGLHQFSARAIDAAGNISVMPSISVTVRNAPAAPANLLATGVSTQINLSWQDLSDNEAGFKIERANAAAGPFSLIQTTLMNVTNYSDATALVGTTYYYRVQSYNSSAASAYSTPSSAMRTTTTDTTSPQVALIDPYSSAKVAGAFQIAATATDNVGVTRLEFYLDSNLLGAVNGPPYIMPANTAGVSDGFHTITVKAFDAAGNVSPPATVTVSVQNANMLTAPSNLFVSSHYTKDALAPMWMDNSTNELGFKVERALNHYGSFTEIIATDGNGFSDRPLASGTEFFYRVRAFNSTGISPYSNVASGRTKTGTDVTPPSTPLNLRGTVDSCTQITLSWDAATDNIRMGGYSVRINENFVTWWVNQADRTGLTREMHPGQVYNFKVAALDYDGNRSLETAQLTLTTPLCQEAAHQQMPRALAGLSAQDLKASSCHGIAVSGPYAYLACDGPGLVVVEISNPLKPLIKGSSSLAFNGRALAIIGDQVAVVDDSPSPQLHVFDLQDPQQPALVSKISIPARKIHAMYESGGLAVMVAENSELLRADLKDPQNPLWVDALDEIPPLVEVPSDNSFDWRLTVRGRNYRASESRIIESWPSSEEDLAPREEEIVKLKLPSTSVGRSAVAYREGYLYLADGTGGFLILELPE
jgi:hypothetical protein